MKLRNLILACATLIPVSYASSIIHLDTDKRTPTLSVYLNKLKPGINYKVVCDIYVDFDRALSQVSVNGYVQDPYFFFNGQRIHYYTVVGLTNGTKLEFPIINLNNQTIVINQLHNIHDVQANCVATSL